MKTGLCVITAACMLLGLPLAGVLLTGHDPGPYLAFPPVTVHRIHAGFSWPVFWIIAFLVLAFVLPLDIRVFKARKNRCRKRCRRFFRYPLWGWAGVIFLGAAWAVAWTRLPVFEPVQLFTFTPLWIGYILIVNALTEARGQPSRLRTRPGGLLVLAVLSCVLWWFFEYLNRFSANWYYTGIEGLAAGTYILYASLPFATVMPAVVCTRDFLSTFDGIGAGLDDFYAVKIAPPYEKGLALSLLVMSGVALAGIGAFPDIFFFALWVAPLGLILGMQVLSGRKTLFSAVKDGQWRTLYQFVLSALVCGFFWEFWNMGSLARWQYAIPYVERFRVFEMPILGYAGYLPFGLECFAVFDMLEPLRNESYSEGGSGY